jgi:K+-sensing histidine kinase KdpD
MKIHKTLRNWAQQITAGYCASDFGVAVGLVATASLVNLLAWPSGSNEDGHYFVLMSAVILSGLYGGLGPGLVATGLGALSSAFFTLLPQFSIEVAAPGAKERLMVFIIEGILLSVPAHVIRNQRRSDAPNVGWQRYLVIPLAVGAAAVPKLVFPGLARELPFAFNYAAVCACAWTGGWLSGVAAVGLLAAITKYFFLEPIYSLAVASHAEAIRVGLFTGEGLLLTILGASHVKLKRLAANGFIRARIYMAGALSREQDAAAIRAISRDTLWEWGLDTGEIVRTPSWQDTLSVALPEREEFASWTERIHPQDRTSTIKRLQQAIEEGSQELQYTYRLLGPGGRVLSVWDHAFIVRGADWKALRVIGRSAEVPAFRGMEEQPTLRG